MTRYENKHKNLHHTNTKTVKTDDILSASHVDKENFISLIWLSNSESKRFKNTSDLSD